MPVGDVNHVRELIGERVTAGSTEADTMFTDLEIGEILDRNGGSISATVAEAWRIKAAAFASLVDTSEGTSKRAMSDLHENALRMAAAAEENIPGAKGTRIHPLKRA